MLLKLYEENPSPRQIREISQCLNKGGVVIYPTDTVYGMGCSIYKSNAVEKISQLKGIDLKKANFSIICNNLSELSTYAKPLNNNIYKVMKKCLPGPYTFILPASGNVPKLFMSKRKTIGIRIPDSNIIKAIVSELGHPVMSTSIEIDHENIEYTIDPELIYEKYSHVVDIVIDGGYGDIKGSTILDCTGEVIEVIREGKGIIDFI